MIFFRINFLLIFFLPVMMAAGQDTTSVLKDSVEYPDSPKKASGNESKSDELPFLSKTAHEENFKRTNPRAIRAEQIRLGKEKFDMAITPVDIDKYYRSRKTGIALTTVGIILEITAVSLITTGFVISRGDDIFNNAGYIGGGAIVGASGIPLLLPGIVTWKRANYRIKKCREL